MAKKLSKPEAGEGPSFEQALEQIEEIMRRLEEGEIGLDQSLAEYEKGVKLLRRCYDLLNRAERRIELLRGVDAEGNPVAEPMDDPSLSSEDRAPGRGPSPGRAGTRHQEGG